MGTYAVIYTYADETPEMAEIRPTHVDFLQKQFDDGRIIVSGRLVDTDPEGALLVMRGESVQDLEELMNDDPLWIGGFITNRRIGKWNVAFNSINHEF
ncbi:YciI family protein [Corynebacterium vitaeruminis]|uniref:YciI family protein n=1 Tax=Corynebacterium vitaeruminis TaxID=38305 RepID=UPI0028AAFB2D|nr:YciI family protein [Corynebacterium vitaeruminis]